MSAILKDPLLQIRPMTEADLTAVMEVELRAFPHHWSEGNFRDCLHAGYECRVLVREEQIIGYGVLSVAADEAHVQTLCIDPEFQGNGLGRRLLERLLNRAKQRRADAVFLEVRTSNRVALDLYRAVGFNEVGVRRGYYPADGGREDAIILALAL
jgi:ribosomal-protein-alanine N-acetyltransferase